MEDIKENKVWETRYWTGGLYKYSTSKECSHKVSWDKRICHDPMSHETHQCKKELCPLYYKRKAKNLNSLKKKL